MCVVQHSSAGYSLPWHKHIHDSICLAKLNRQTIKNGINVDESCVNVRKRVCIIRIHVAEDKHEPKTFISICKPKKQSHLWSKRVFLYAIVSVGRFIANEHIQFPFSQKSFVVIKRNEKKFARIYIQFVVRMRSARIFLSAKCRLITNATKRNLYMEDVHAHKQTL